MLQSIPAVWEREEVDSGRRWRRNGGHQSQLMSQLRAEVGTAQSLPALRRWSAPCIGEMLVKLGEKVGKRV